MIAILDYGAGNLQSVQNTLGAIGCEYTLVRDAEGLRHLLAEAHPLARMIARSALARTESRGAHQRADDPGQDAAFDLRHAVLAGRADAVTAAVTDADTNAPNDADAPADGEVEWQTWM